jgi:hypothetical protein
LDYFSWFAGCYEDVGPDLSQEIIPFLTITSER